MEFYNSNPVLKRALDQVRAGVFSKAGQETEFADLVDNLKSNDRWVQ